MRKLILLVLLCINAHAQQSPTPPKNFMFGEQPPQTPAYNLSWTEGDGYVAIPEVDMFGQVTGRLELDWTPRILDTISPITPQQLLHLTGHLGIWIWMDGIHGNWYDDVSKVRRLFRTRWGLPAPGVEVKIVISWDQNGYVVIIDDVLRIHDWQNTMTSVFPDSDITTGFMGNYSSGGRPATGSFNLRVYDLPMPYGPCGVDIVGTINETIPLDNTGEWSQGIDPRCFTGTATFSWVNATKNEDGTDLLLSQIQSIGFYDSNTSQQITTVPPVPTTTVLDVPFGNQCFYATTINTDAIESIPSATVCKDVQ